MKECKYVIPSSDLKVFMLKLQGEPVNHSLNLMGWVSKMYYIIEHYETTLKALQPTTTVYKDSKSNKWAFSGLISVVKYFEVLQTKFSLDAIIFFVILYIIFIIFL